MRVLLDECLPARLKAAFPGHAVRTVPETGWRSSKDGPLLAFAQEHFDVFITIDRALEHEHDLTAFRLGFVIARVRSNRLVDFQPILPALAIAVQRVRLGEIVHVADPRLAGR